MNVERLSQDALESLPMVKKRKRSELTSSLLNASLVALTVLSIFVAVRNAVSRSQDFQWSGERLLFHHIDPWRNYLLGDPAHALIGTQVPNYLPVLYFVLIPFGLLPATSANLAWALCNAVFAVTSATLAARFYNLRSFTWKAAVTALLLAAVPTRTSIGNGQQGLFVLFLWSVALLTPQPNLSPRRAMLAGISYLKYSFAPAIALFLVLRNGLRDGLRVLFWTFVPSAIATVALWLWITGKPGFPRIGEFVIEPLAVAKSGYQPTSDPGITLMDLGEFALGGNSIARPRLTVATFAIAVAFTSAILLLALRKLKSRREDPASPLSIGWLLALTSTMSFAFYKHHAYDEVVLLFPLCYALVHRAQTPARLALVIIGYHWFIQRLFDARLHFSWLWNTIRLSSFCLLIACIYFTERTERPPSSEENCSRPVL